MAMPSPSSPLLVTAGILSSIVAAVHLATIVIGAPAYRYLGAGEKMARMSDRGALTPTVLTLVLTAIFALWAAYAFSGAHLIRRLPLLKISLAVIGTIYTLRGLVLIPQILLSQSNAGSEIPTRHLFFSTVSLVIGLVYLVGTVRVWRHL